MGLTGSSLSWKSSATVPPRLPAGRFTNVGECHRRVTFVVQQLSEEINLSLEKSAWMVMAAHLNMEYDLSEYCTCKYTN
jgi:hypothetical protein